MIKVKIPEPDAWAATDETETVVESLGMNESRRFSDPLFLKHKMEAYADARVRESQQWQPIETAPKTGRKVLLGFVNSHGNWRTMLGLWISKEEILNELEDDDLFDEGWYEISVEADDTPNCWLTNPSHWMPLPPPPVEPVKQSTR